MALPAGNYRSQYTQPENSKQKRQLPDPVHLIADQLHRPPDRVHFFRLSETSVLIGTYQQWVRLTAVMIVMVAAQKLSGVTQKSGVATRPKIAIYPIKMCNVRSLAAAPCSLHQFFVAYSQLGIEPRD